MTATFSCTLKFLVKDCDPNTGEPDDEGYDDEYVVSIRASLYRNVSCTLHRIVIFDLTCTLSMLDKELPCAQPGQATLA